MIASRSPALFVLAVNSHAIKEAVVSEIGRTPFMRSDLDVLLAENARLRAALEEVANHRIDSELASREKREMARKAIQG
jgi:hypothetical protein